MATHAKTASEEEGIHASTQHFARAPYARGRRRRRRLAAAPSGASALGVALSTSGWNWTNPAPQGNTLNGIAFTGNTGFAYARGGTILRTDDGGDTWKGLATGTSALIYDVDLVDANTIVARVGGQQPCSLRLSTDGGATFTRIVFDGQEATCDVPVQSVDFRLQDRRLRADGRRPRPEDQRRRRLVRHRDEGRRRQADRVRRRDHWLRHHRLAAQEDAGRRPDLERRRRTAGERQRHPPAVADDDRRLGQQRARDLHRRWREVDGEQPRRLNPQSVSCRSITQCALYGANTLAWTIDGGATTSKVTIGNDDVRAVGYGAGSRLVAIGKRGVTYLSDDDGLTFRRTSSDPVAEAITNIDVRGGGGPVGITDNVVSRG